jgi:uncharacterized membrane protein YjjP (DUF1212 family)
MFPGRLRFHGVVVWRVQMTPAAVQPLSFDAGMTREERSNLILAFARVLYINGESTELTVSTAGRLSQCLGLRATIFLHWGELEVQTEDADGTSISAVPAAPFGVDMDRVASTLRTVEKLCDGRLAPANAMEAISKIAEAPPAPMWLFTLAAAAGAVALAVLFGVRHLTASALIFGSAAAGAVLRRTLARYSTNVFLQPLSAALVAGMVGALAVRFQLSSSLRLVAVCPCMVLVPGPHFLNGMLDLIRGHMNLGAARLIYAVLIVVAISTGLLLGLALFGVSLPVDPAARTLPLWQDALAAGLAVACYSVFFSTPWQMFAWPVAVGTVAHALRWVALTALGASTPMGAFVACLVVGLVIAPVSRRFHMPFAAIGFASVVSTVPGVLMFRMASGLTQLTSSSQPTWDLLGATLADGWLAALIILAMSFGLIVPKLLMDFMSER